MATANPSTPTESPTASGITARRRRKRWLVRSLVLVVLLPAGLAAFFWRPLHGYTLTGAAYGARVACSCRFEGGRSLGDCRKDFEDGMGLVTLSENTAAKSVTATFPPFARQTATYREGWGCVLEPWKE